jgi:hypothetical protein
MNKTFHYLGFARSFMLNGVGMLVLCAPSTVWQDVGVFAPNIATHFESVGMYMNLAIAQECPDILAEVEKEYSQLEFHLPT